VKRFFSLSLLVLVFLFGCSKKGNEKFTAFSPEAFAYDLGDGWELNSTVRVKGFTQNEADKKFSASVSFSIDLVTPQGETKKGLFQGDEKKENNEKFSDLPLEAQIELDSTYKAGKYKVVYNIKDNLSGQTATIEKDFEISKD
jgi:hypothetical protein